MVLKTITSWKFWKLCGGSNEYPQSMFWIKIKENRYIILHPMIIKGAYKGVFISQTRLPGDMYMYHVNIDDWRI